LITAATITLAAYYVSLDYANIGMLHFIGAAIFIGLLIYQHTLVKANDLSKVNMAFFTTNGVASVIFGLLLILDLYI
jgi:4-hydroxybenzoate polyprenyltransferase